MTEVVILVVIFIAIVIKLERRSYKRLREIEALKVEKGILTHQKYKLYKSTFRQGDQVFLNKKGTPPNQPVFLRESFNKDEYWLVSKDKEGPYSKRHQVDGVHVSELSHSPITRGCKCSN